MGRRSRFSEAEIIGFLKEVESVALYGLTDVVYYCSADGELAVRSAVFAQIFQGLETTEIVDEVRLHIVAHSLGVTIAYDLMFGLFAPSTCWAAGGPDFLHLDAKRVGEVHGAAAQEAAMRTFESTKAAYTKWRDHAQQRVPTLTLGSMSSSASQLPLLVMRRQSLVDALASRRLLDAKVIGIREARVRWKLFYDEDDVLGFPTKPLFEPNEAIEELQVDTSWLASKAHVRYWTNDAVITETARLIEANVG